MWDFSKIEQFDAAKFGTIICICGKSGLGKSYLANKLKNEKTVVIDGDSLRYYVNYNLNFTNKDRYKNNVIAANIAYMLSRQGFDVIISTVRSDLAKQYLNLRYNIKCKLIKIEQ